LLVIIIVVIIIVIFITIIIIFININIIILPLVLDSQRLRNNLENYKTLGATLLVKKLCWQVSK